MLVCWYRDALVQSIVFHAVDCDVGFISAHSTAECDTTKCELSDVIYANAQIKRIVRPLSDLSLESFKSRATRFFLVILCTYELIYVSSPVTWKLSM